jgi:hypothetical protein
MPFDGHYKGFGPYIDPRMDPKWVQNGSKTGDLTPRSIDLRVGSAIEWSKMDHFRASNGPELDHLDNHRGRSWIQDLLR